MVTIPEPSLAPESTTQKEASVPQTTIPKMLNKTKAIFIQKAEIVDFVSHYRKIREPDGLMAYERLTKPGVSSLKGAKRSIVIWPYS